MTKITLTPVTNLNNGSAVQTINQNYNRIVAGLEDALSKRGDLPNHMEVDLDLDGNDIINVGKISADDFVLGGSSVLGVLERAEKAVEDAEEAAQSSEDSAQEAAMSAGAAENFKMSAEDAAQRAENAAGSVEYPVSYEPQTLTASQQAQARQNIQADKSYDSISSVVAATVPAFVNAIRTNGYYAAGDGGGALYTRVATEPTHAGKVQSADGAWWELTGWQSDVKKFNVITTPSDSTLALQRAVDYAVENGGSIPISTETLYITEPIIIKPSKTVPADVLSSDVHFKDLRAVNIFGSARHTIKAAPGFVGGELLKFTYNDAISTQSPMWSQVGGIVLDGSDLVDTAILLDWCMNVEIRRIGIIGTARGVRNIGYGVSNIERSAFRCSSAGVDFSEGGGDSWITKNDFYCPSNSVLIGSAGGNTRVFRNTFNRQDADLTSSDLPIAVNITPVNGAVRDVTIEDNEFCGMNFGVYAQGTSTNSMSRIRVIGNHTIPSVGGFLSNHHIIALKYGNACDVSNNKSGGRYIGSDNGASTKVPILIENTEATTISTNTIFGSRGAAISINEGWNCNIVNNVLYDTGQTGPSYSSIYAFNTQRCVFANNNGSQSSSTFAQKFLEEAGTSTNNGGANMAYGYTTKYTLASGSTSIFT